MELPNDLTIERLEALVAKLKEKESEPIGDGKGTFIEPMTDEEYARWEHEEELGWRKWLVKYGLLPDKGYGETESE